MTVKYWLRRHKLRKLYKKYGNWQDAYRVYYATNQSSEEK